MNASKRRTISEATKERAFSLWLSGMSYRKIVSETKMSMGAVNKLIENARATTPNLDDLRDLNRKLMDSGSSVFDAIRGEKLLEEINLLNVDLEDLASFGVLVKKISLEKNIEAKDFVDSAMRLIVLEKQTGKPCEDLVKEFEGLSSRVLEHQEHVDQLNNEAKTLKQEIKKIRATFSGQNLTLEEGLEKLAKIGNLQLELDAVTFDLEEANKKIVKAEKEVVRIQKTDERFKSSNAEYIEKNKIQKMMNEDLEKNFAHTYGLLQESWQHKEDLERDNEDLLIEHNQVKEKMELAKQLLQKINGAIKGGKHILADYEAVNEKITSLEKENKKKIEKTNAVCLEKIKKAEEKVKEAEVEEKKLRRKVEIWKSQKDFVTIARSAEFSENLLTDFFRKKRM